MASSEPVYPVLSNSLLSICSSLLNDMQDGHPQSMFEGPADLSPSVLQHMSEKVSFGSHHQFEREGGHSQSGQDDVGTLQENVYGQTIEEVVGESVDAASSGNIHTADVGSGFSRSFHQFVQDKRTNIQISAPSVSPEQIGEKLSHESEEVCSGRKYTCQECGKVFKYRRFYREHCRIHTGERPHECKYCGKSFRQSNALYIHERVHTGAKPFKCSMCDKAFGRRDTLKTHIRTHTGDKPYTCSFCDRTFNQRSSLIFHEKVHTNDRKFTCDKCGMRFRRKLGLQNHQRLSSTTRKCSYCEMECGNLCELNVHKQNKHVDKVFVCDECGTSFTTKVKYEKHASCNRNNHLLFVCKECARTFDSVSDLGEHDCTKLGKNAFTCDVCGMVFNSSDEWKSHRVGHAEEEMFECSQCDMVFKAKKNLTRHLSLHKDTSSDSSLRQVPVDNQHYEDDKREVQTTNMMQDIQCSLSSPCHEKLRSNPHEFLSHTSTICNPPDLEEPIQLASCILNQKATMTNFPEVLSNSPQPRDSESSGSIKTQMFVCTDCGKVFGKRRSFTAHRRTHRTDRPYKCRFCGMGFKQSITLKHHVRQHTGEKPYVCNVCDTAFSRSDTLGTHMLIHSGAKPYKCKFCDKQFSQRSSRFFHEKAHKKEKCFCCDACGARFSQRYGLIVHQKEATRPRRCTECAAEFGTVCALNIHQDACHTEEKHTCEQCGRSFSSKKGLDRHKPCDPTLPCYYVCANCKKTFHCKKLFSDHDCKGTDRADDPDPPEAKSRFTCEQCGKQFVRKSCYLSHSRVHSSECRNERKYERSHTGERPYTCSVCKKSLSTKNSWQLHMQIHTHPPLFKCSLCDKAFHGKFYYEQHQRRHSREKPYCCEVCGIRSKARITLIKHFSCDDMQQCSDCGNSFPNLCAARVHCAENHQNEYLCACCGESFPSSAELVKHQPCNLSRASLYVCRNCFKTFPSLTNLSSHPCAPRNMGAFCCNHCTKSFSHVDQLRTHKKSHTGLAFHECSVCKLIFDTQKSLDEHVALHDSSKINDLCLLNMPGKQDKSSNKNLTGDKSDPLHVPNVTSALVVDDASGTNNETSNIPKGMFMCPQCHSLFKHKDRLTAHMVSHSGEKPFHCVECGNAFPRKESLRTHIQRCHKADAEDIWRMSLMSVSHTVETATFPCFECDMVFATKILQVKHIRSHKFFTCELCPRTLKTKRSLFYHMENQHGKSHSSIAAGHQQNNCSSSESHTPIDTGKKTFTCSECSVSFYQESVLEAHIELRHLSRFSQVMRMSLANVHSSKNEEDHHHKCSLCGKTFQLLRHLHTHLKVHQRVNDLKCSACNKSFCMKKDLRKHIKLHHFEQFEKVLHDSLSISSHMSLPQPEREFKCLECEGSFKSEAHLEDHLTCHGKQQKLWCEACSCGCSSLQNWISHIQEFHKDPPMTCPCGQLFRDLESLLKHFESMSCEICTCIHPSCDISFVLHCQLEKHLESHTSVLTEAGQLEGVTSGHSTRNSEVFDSSSLESNEFPFECHVCGRKFAVKAYLTHHRRYYHRKKRHQCIICLMSFFQKYELSNHIRVCHEDCGTEPGKEKGDRTQNACGDSFAGGSDKNEAKLQAGFESGKEQSTSGEKENIDAKDSASLDMWKERPDLTKESDKFCAEVLARVPMEQEQATCVENDNLEVTGDSSLNSGASSIPCQECGMKFTQRSHLSNHVRIHQSIKNCTQSDQDKGDQTTNACKDNPANGSEQDGAERQARKNEPSPSGEKDTSNAVGSSFSGTSECLYECPECDKIFEHEFKLGEHMCPHQIEQTSFSFCSESFSSNKKMKDHIRIYHVDSADQYFQFHCSDCDRKFAQKAHLASHMRSHKTVEKKCNVCSESFSSKKKMKDHIRSCHVDSANQYFQFQCSDCDRKFAQKSHLASHMRSHETVEYKCIVCGESFPMMSKLVGHIRLRHLDRITKEMPMEKEHPEGSFSGATEIGDSISAAQCVRSEIVSKPIKGKASSNGLNKLPEKCTECYKKFKSKLSLKTHMRCHKGCYVCSVCSHSFSVKADLERHGRDRHPSNNEEVLNASLPITRKQRKFQCSDCAVSFCYLAPFKKHLETKHPDKKFKIVTYKTPKVGPS